MARGALSGTLGAVAESIGVLRNVWSHLSVEVKGLSPDLLDHHAAAGRISVDRWGVFRNHAASPGKYAVIRKEDWEP